MLDLFIPGAAALLVLLLRLLDGRRTSDWPSLFDFTIILASSWTVFILVCRAILLLYDALLIHPVTTIDSFKYLRPGDQRYWFFGCISLFVISLYGIGVRFPSLKGRLKSKLEKDLDQSNSQVETLENKWRETEELLTEIEADRYRIEQLAIRYKGERDGARKDLLDARAEASELHYVVVSYETRIAVLRGHMPHVLRALQCNGHDPEPTNLLLEDLRNRPQPPPSAC